MIELTNEQVTKLEESFSINADSNQEKDPFIVKTINSICIYEPKDVNIALVSEDEEIVDGTGRKVSTSQSKKQL